MQLRVCKLKKFAPKVGGFCTKRFGFVCLTRRLKVAAWFLLQSGMYMFTCISACVCEEPWGFSIATRVRVECPLEVN